VEKRKDRYIDIDTANVAQFGITTNHDGLFDLSGFGAWADGADTYVLCDVFGKGKEVMLADGMRRRAGVPILYYRADTSGKVSEDVYHVRDNADLVFIKEMSDRARKGTAPAGTWNPLDTGTTFYDLISDPRATTANFAVPHKPDSYILISAGADGFYGTADDICNFQK
jgi:hypothetical protein